MSSTVGSSGIVRHVVEFGRALRARGVPVGPGETADAARVAAGSDLLDRRELYFLFRTLFVSRHEDFAAFDELFEGYWSPAAMDPAALARGPQVERGFPSRTRKHGPPSSQPPQLSLDRWLKADTSGDESVDLLRASAGERLARKDFSAFTDAEMDEIARVARQLARRLASRRSRRWRAARKGARTRVDMRRTIRRSLKTGGDAAELAFREPKIRKTRLVVLCDVSGSMDLYSRFLLQFVHALQNTFARVDSYVFSTRLSRITDELRGGTYRRALASLAEGVRDWSGGTKTGESLAAFVRQSGRQLDRRTVVVILSDGWETGDPSVLTEALRAIKVRAGRIVWLNPLLGTPGYRPVTQGMEAALPFIDVLAPVHNLESLRGLLKHLAL
jgi:uncharacterized protein with von Willebrand factor type A (vWA) domain